MSKISRRVFVKGAAAGAVAMTFPISRVLGANEQVNLGVIGMGGRGSEEVAWFGKLPGVKIAAVCDPDPNRVAAALKKTPGAKGQTDLRKVIEDKDINAVVISTCNHWHALAAIWAIQAGKDVYCEKPVSQTVWEGRKIVEAARKYNRIVQGGTQQRSDQCQDQLHEFIKSEQLGKLQWIRGSRFGKRDSIGKVAEPIKPPAGLDYNLWLGPAQDLPMHRKNFHYDWHWIWNTGSGEMGNWGVHILDDIRNMLFDKCTLPRRILAGGGRVAWDDAGETPNMHYVYFDTGIVPVLFSLSNLPAKAGTTQEPAYRGTRSGFVLQFEGGHYAGGRGGGWASDKDGKRIKQFKDNRDFGPGGGFHAQNFIDAVRTRDRKIQKAEIEETHYSSSWCHLANIAYRLGGAYNRENTLNAAKDLPAWSETIEQFEQICVANNVDLGKAGLKGSTFLELDPAKETFVGPSATKEALALLTREYRKGFEVPDKV